MVKKKSLNSTDKKYKEGGSNMREFLTINQNKMEVFQKGKNIYQAQVLAGINTVFIESVAEVYTGQSLHLSCK